MCRLSIFLTVFLIVMSTENSWAMNKIFNSPDLELEDIREIYDFSEINSFPSDRNILGMFLSDKDIQKEIVSSIPEHHHTLGWLFSLEGSKNSRVVSIHSRTLVPRYRCYFNVNKATPAEPWQGCKYINNK